MRTVVGAPKEEGRKIRRRHSEPQQHARYPVVLSLDRRRRFFCPGRRTNSVIAIRIFLRGRKEKGEKVRAANAAALLFFVFRAHPLARRALIHFTVRFAAVSALALSERVKRVVITNRSVTRNRMSHLRRVAHNFRVLV